MIRPVRDLVLSLALAAGLAAPAQAIEACRGYGPQTPRDIADAGGSNPRVFSLAESTASMNLCNIHTHTNAEHKGPGFSISGGDGEHGGWKCNETESLTEADLAPSEGAFHGAKPGDTIEVHWVFSSCAVAPGHGLGACLSEACANPQLRVESQVFLVVNDPSAINFEWYSYGNTFVNGFHQPRQLPAGTGTPVVFAGSTTGPKYTEQACSPLQVTWSVRPKCAKVDIGSLHRWASNNPFGENHSHGVRQIVTSPELLAPIR